jgi:RHS repeat-associated protein
MQTQNWEMRLKHDDRGLEIERVLTGGVVSRNQYDDTGRIYRNTVTTKGRETRRMRYQWSQNDRLMGIVNELNDRNTWFDYDTMGNLTGSTFNETEKLFRVPDAVGNLYRTADRKDRKYGAGGRLLETEDTKFHYDEEGNLAAKVDGKGHLWRYLWNANGSLKEVVRPDYRSVKFEYDALGRRTAKVYDNKVTRWVWDGNTPLHEWSYEEKDRPKTVTDEFGIKSKDREEPAENIITWVFEEGSFRPAAKLTDDKKYSIITDYLGTPAQMYDEEGKLTWEMDLDIYGKVRTFEGCSLSECPFRYQGQYETGLYYNRHRYYDPAIGAYLSKDPIGLEGGFKLYGYVNNPNNWIDSTGLTKTCSNRSR